MAPERPHFDPEIARSILGFRFSEAQNARMRKLAEKNSQGALTKTEAEETESYRRVGNLLALLQAKARLALENAGEPEQ